MQTDPLRKKIQTCFPSPLCYIGTLLSGFVLALSFVLSAIAASHCSSSGTTAVPKTGTKKRGPRARPDFDEDKRRKHHHYLVTVYYADGEKFGRVYTDKAKAGRFADRQRRSPIVKMARVSRVS
jgi:hypothetical protein